MVDISAIAGTVSALKGAVDITKAMIGLHDAQAVQAKVIELNAKILEAQISAFAANDERAALIERIGHLEKEVVQLKAWEAEKQRYQLTDVGDGVVAYALKQGVETTEATHLLCAHCYQQNKKSHLQPTQELHNRRRVHVCPNCKNRFTFGHVPRLPDPPTASKRYNPFGNR